MAKVRLFKGGFYLSGKIANQIVYYMRGDTLCARVYRKPNDARTEKHRVRMATRSACLESARMKIARLRPPFRGLGPTGPTHPMRGPSD